MRYQKRNRRFHFCLPSSFPPQAAAPQRREEEPAGQFSYLNHCVFCRVLLTPRFKWVFEAELLCFIIYVSAACALTIVQHQPQERMIIGL